MDKQLVAEKLEALRRCIRRIKQKSAHTAEELVLDFDKQDIISLNLTRAIQICVDIASHIITGSELTAPSTMAESFDSLVTLGLIDKEIAESLKSAVGFRNIAIHNYHTIDWKIVYHITQDKLDDFKIFTQNIEDHLSLD